MIDHVLGYAVFLLVLFDFFLFSAILPLCVVSSKCFLHVCGWNQAKERSV